MSVFDKLAGLSEASDLTRRPLRTLGEAGGAERSTPDTTMDHGPGPKDISPSPNTRYRAQPKQAYGSDGTMKGKGKAAALRTGKPAQYNTK
jgi:hypothetical protein